MKQMILLTTILLAACQATNWNKPGASQAQAERDYAECDYEAKKATAGIINGFEAGWMQAEIRSDCLRLRGYRR